MSEQHSRWPLEWPGNWPRTKATARRRASFTRVDRKTSIAMKDGAAQVQTSTRTIAVSTIVAVQRLEYQLDRIEAKHVILSTNVELRLDGRPRSSDEPADPGAAVYFKLHAGDRCLACDKWDRVADNIAALAAHIDALRRIDRYGVGTLDQAFRGYTALQPATQEWWLVLGCRRDASLDEINSRFTTLAKTHHPDRGGDVNQMARLTEARRLALEEKGAA